MRCWLHHVDSDLGPVISAGLLHLAEGGELSKSRGSHGWWEGLLIFHQTKPRQPESSSPEKEVVEARQRGDWAEKGQRACERKDVLASAAETCGSQSCKLRGLSQGEHGEKEVQD